MSNAYDPEELVACPYDPVHMVLRKRMQYHLMKCRKNFNHHDYKTCPFNARHIVPRPEFDYHIRECPDRARVDAEVLQQRRQKDPFQLKGCTDIPVSDWTAPEVSESWDDDNVAYVPPSHDGLLSSSELAEREERLSPKREEPPKAVVKEPPQPRMPQIGAHMDSQLVYHYSLASMKDQQPSSQVMRTHPIGLGRGRGSGRGSAPPGFQQMREFVPQQPVGVLGRGVTRVPVLGAGRGVVGVPMVGTGGSVNGMPVLGAGREVAGVTGVDREVMENSVQPSTLVHPRQPPAHLPGPPPGFSAQVMPSGAVAQPAVQGMSEEELQKRERKLRKMLRQIENLELKLAQGEQLDPEALAKISRKGDVLDKIEEIEKLK